MVQLSSLEEYFYYRCKLNLHSCFYLAVTLNEIPTGEQLIDALRETIKSHPKTHCTVTIPKDGSKPEMKNLTDVSIHLDDVVEYSPWEELDAGAMNSIFKNYSFAFDNGKPMWKIIILEKSKQLVFALSHIIFDGMSSTYFASTFMEKLNSVEKTVLDLPKDILYSSGDNIDLAPHPYEKLPISWAWWAKRSLVKLLLKVSPGVVMNTDPGLLQFKSYNFPDDFIESSASDSKEFEVKNNNTQKLLRIDQNVLPKLMKDCKDRGVSLNTFLVTLFAVALTKVDKNVLKNGKKVNINIPISTRNFCHKSLGVDETELQIGDFIAGMEYCRDLDSMSDDKFWETSKEVQTFIKDFVDTQIPDAINTAKLLDIANVEDFIREKVQRAYGVGPSAAFEVSNLGFCKFGNETDDRDRKYYVTDAFFNQPQGFSNIFTCSVITTHIGGLTCSISYPSELTTDIQPVWDYVDGILEIYK